MYRARRMQPGAIDVHVHLVTPAYSRALEAAGVSTP
jgi:hypothetical protein